LFGLILACIAIVMNAKKLKKINTFEQSYSYILKLFRYDKGL